MQAESRPTMRDVVAQLRDRALARLADAYPPTAAALVVTIGLVAHEVAYHLTGGTDFPLQVLATDTRILVISHGGLDALGIGALAVATIAALDVARQRRRDRSGG
jgi:hypothetical protein